MPFSFSFCFRNGDVGGDRGFDAALAFLICDAGESEFEGCSIKMKISIHNTTPTMIVSGFARRSDRTGRMPLYCWVSSIDAIWGSKLACVNSGAAVSVVRLITEVYADSILSP